MTANGNYLNDDDHSSIRRILLTYLIYNCYEETAIAFIKAISYGDSKLKDFDSTTNDHSKFWDLIIAETNGVSQKDFKMDPEGDIEMKSTAPNALRSDFSSATSSNPLQDPVIIEMIKSLAQRKEILNLIRTGDITHAIQQYSKLFSEEEENLNDIDTLDISFQLHCLQFIELVRDGKHAEALYYAQQHLSDFGRKRSSFLLPLREDIVALIAYQEPEKSPIGHYLSKEHAETVVESVNRAILAKVIDVPSLIKIVRQALVVKHYLNELKDDSGKEFGKRSPGSSKLPTLQDLVGIE